MKTPLDNLPLNTNAAYAMAVFPNGCELYFPVDTRDEKELLKARDDMQAYLNYEYPNINTPA